ncbi:SGNH hydrolase-like domain-containing protein, acetyltransferase AlgX [Streptoalloteichus tenebrarius]|uniref:SGNH hydrolase-like domain-containing protein, acetyltransferase AlgX n=2 Tax=Streptoalloteichus tenebrarius (strain ATCC 17920 / DSM 40477 / JCM 4838 / CBS 697.72 / NBRC 16177 / NCIMB 11028 / NRRL B-12390 / A12253. 1 / ISP 5477) TaxID=1933 RepID=A0ABT1I3X3_STRSD|nr:hypothetical protein [Streptoalloteichus tenebrarius]MCP2262491.1 SGNH hydrolase-like domain-containing protein, acetyltransferase AlgX [Streptoalloteichus tenebrarius]
MVVQDRESSFSPLPWMHESLLPQEHPLHRPRHGGRQLAALVCALVFFAAPTLGWVFGARPAEIENRPLARFPSVTDGWGFFTGMGQWATDHLTFRQGAVSAADGISRAVFGEPAPLGQGQKPAGPVGPAAPDQEPTTDQSSGFRKVLEGRGGWLYFGYDIEGKCRPARPLDATITQLNKLRSVVEASGRRFVLVVEPDKATMVPEHLPSNYAGKECSAQAREEFWRRVPAEAGALDLRPALRKAAETAGRPIYPKLDTHWDGEGGVVMARAVAEAARPGVTERWTTERRGEVRSDADLPPLMGRPREEKTTQLYALRPDGAHDRARSVDTDFRKPVRVTSEPGQGVVSERTILLGDSFSIVTSRYLAAGFADLTLMNYVDFAQKIDAHASLLADRQVVVFSMVERNLVAGRSPLTEDRVIERIGQVLQANPVR